MPLNKSSRDLYLYVAIGLLFVLLVIGGTFYAPSALDHISRWLIFVGISGFVFGYQLYDFWSYRVTPRFWLAMILLFACHFEFWLRYVRPHFGGDPRWIAGGAITFMEYVVVSITMKLILPSNNKAHGVNPK